MAHKKAAGSAKNLRDSNAKYRGLKLSGGQSARAGNIIIRQKGSTYVCGENTYMGKDFTIHATIDGIVVFGKKKYTRFDGRKYLKTFVTVVPYEEYQAQEKSEEKVIEAKKAPKAKKATEAKKVEKTKTPAKKEKAVAKKVPSKKTAAKKTAPKKTDTTGNDDLTKIEGIGPKIQEVFYAAGIKTYADLSGSKVGDLRTILADNGLSQHDPKTWKKQATLAKNGKWDALKELQDELNGGK